MTKQVTQKLVNQKCELLRSQNEEITVHKVRKLIGEGVSIIDLVEKVTLYKNDRKQAIITGELEQELTINTVIKDELLEAIKSILKESGIKEDKIAYSLRNNIKQYIDKEISKSINKIKQKQVEISNKNDSLEIANLTLDRRYKELLEK